MKNRHKLKQNRRRIRSNKFRRILQIYRLKRRILNRHRIGFVFMQS